MPIGVAGVRFCESAPTGFDRPLEISPLEAISGPPFSGRNPGTEYGPTLLVPDFAHLCRVRAKVASEAAEFARRLRANGGRPEISGPAS